MASLEVILSISAMGMASKLDILTQEVSRRLRNCTIDLPWEEKISTYQQTNAQYVLGWLHHRS